MAENAAEYNEGSGLTDKVLIVCSAVGWKDSFVR